jgi:hypothetical protein
MIGQLTKAERQYALLILLGLALCGLIFGIAGKDDPVRAENLNPEVMVMKSAQDSA